MALKIHIIARTWTPPHTAALHMEALCGEPGYKHHAGINGRNEWEAARRIGGLRAVPEREFMPSRYDDCAKCRKQWMAGAGDA